MSDIDYESEEELEDEFEAGFATWTAHSEVSPEHAEREQAAKDKIRSVTTDEFINEAITYATGLKNLLGDSDGVVAEYSSAIVSNLTVVALEIQNDPVGFLLSFARAIEDPKERANWARAAHLRLLEFAMLTDESIKL